MVINRRTFVANVAVLLAGAMQTYRSAYAETRAKTTDSLYAAARRHQDGRFSAALIGGDGRDIHSVALPARGHDATFCPVTRRCVMFARRPGNFAVVFTADKSASPLVITTPEDRHFCGHGVFSRDGRLLFATENDFENGRGIIGIYDGTRDFRRVGEFPSYGIGPHDMALLHMGPVLVIANGGLREHPDFGGGRRILNPGDVVTSLVYVDLRLGGLLERHELPRHEQISLRHLGVTPDDTVMLGAQALNKGDRDCTLLFRHRRQSPLAAIELPVSARTSLAGYISSVAVDREGKLAAVTSSRGGTMLILNTATGKVLHSASASDISGVAPTSDHGAFLATTGDGTIVAAQSGGGLSQLVAGPWAWDNHVAAA